MQPKANYYFRFFAVTELAEVRYVFYIFFFFCETTTYFIRNFLLFFSKMPPIDPRLVKAKRFPVHAAVTICHLPEVKRLLTEDAEFHIVRKIPDLELGVLHSACASRHGSLKIFIEIVRYLVEVIYHFDEICDPFFFLSGKIQNSIFSLERCTN